MSEKTYLQFPLKKSKRKPNVGFFKQLVILMNKTHRQWFFIMKEFSKHILQKLLKCAFKYIETKKIGNNFKPLVKNIKKTFQHKNYRKKD